MTTFRFTSGAMQNPHSEFLSFETSWAGDIQPISECSMTAKTFCEKHAKHENTNVLEMFLLWNNHSHPHVGDAARAAQPQQVSDNGHSTNAAWCKKHQIQVPNEARWRFRQERHSQTPLRVRSAQRFGAHPCGVAARCIVQRCKFHPEPTFPCIHTLVTCRIVVTLFMVFPRTNIFTFDAGT